MKQILFIAVLFMSCTNGSDFVKGKRLLEMQGFTDIQKTGYPMLCCAEKDVFSTGFKCKSKDGTVVRGCFCSGFFKGITIRFE